MSRILPAEAIEVQLQGLLRHRGMDGKIHVDQMVNLAREINFCYEFKIEHVQRSVYCSRPAFDFEKYHLASILGLVFGRLQAQHETVRMGLKFWCNIG